VDADIGLCACPSGQTGAFHALGLLEVAGALRLADHPLPSQQLKGRLAANI